MSGFKLLLLIIFLTGCSRSWVRPETSQQQIDVDSFACEEQAERMFPVTLVAMGSNSNSPEIVCDHNGILTKCRSVGSTSGPPLVFDRNKEARSDAVSKCLESMGYTWE